MKNSTHVYNPHVSVDCVVFGFDGEKLKVLLIERTIEEQNFSDKKLPGSIIFEDEDLDEAAIRILNELWQSPKDKEYEGQKLAGETDKHENRQNRYSRVCGTD